MKIAVGSNGIEGLQNFNNRHRSDHGMVIELTQEGYSENFWVCTLKQQNFASILTRHFNFANTSNSLNENAVNKYLIHGLQLTR